MAFCEVSFPRSIVMSLVVVSQKAFPPEEGAVPEAGRKEKGGVYRPEDVFQLLLLTPFQSKLSGLFQVTSGQNAVGFACPLGVEAKTASPWVRGEVGIIYLVNDSCGTVWTGEAAGGHLCEPFTVLCHSRLGARPSERRWGTQSSPGALGPSWRLVRK